MEQAPFARGMGSSGRYLDVLHVLMSTRPAERPIGWVEDAMPLRGTQDAVEDLTLWAAVTSGRQRCEGTDPYQ